VRFGVGVSRRQDANGNEQRAVRFDVVKPVVASGLVVSCKEEATLGSARPAGRGCARRRRSISTPPVASAGGA
jgi:hypothetical protein